jgi:hypothetical protein
MSETWTITKRPQRDGTVEVTATLGARVIHNTFKNLSEADKFGQAEAQRGWDLAMMKWKAKR